MILTERASLVSYLFRTYHKEIKIARQTSRQVDIKNIFVASFITQNHNGTYITMDVCRKLYVIYTAKKKIKGKEAMV